MAVARPQSRASLVVWTGDINQLAGEASICPDLRGTNYFPSMLPLGRHLPLQALCPSISEGTSEYFVTTLCGGMEIAWCRMT